VAYLAQLTYGVLLILHPHDSDDVINLCFVVFTTLVMSLERAWSLLRGKHVASAQASAATGGDDPQAGSGPGH
jgi:hypothetical protein